MCIEYLFKGTACTKRGNKTQSQFQHRAAEIKLQNKINGSGAVGGLMEAWGSLAPDVNSKSDLQ